MPPGSSSRCEFVVDDIDVGESVAFDLGSPRLAGMVCAGLDWSNAEVARTVLARPGLYAAMTGPTALLRQRSAATGPPRSEPQRPLFSDVRLRRAVNYVRKAA